MRYILIILLFISFNSYGQGVSNFGATRPQDTSKTKGQIVATAYGIIGDTAVIIAMPNGTFKQVPISIVRGYDGSNKVDSNTISNDSLYYWINGTSYFVGVISGGGGGTAWGSITGTLSDQTDLQNALDGKVDTGSDNYIKNQNADYQNANFKLRGNGEAYRFIARDTAGTNLFPAFMIDRTLVTDQINVSCVGFGDHTKFTRVNTINGPAGYCNFDVRADYGGNLPGKYNVWLGYAFRGSLNLGSNTDTLLSVREFNGAGTLNVGAVGDWIGYYYQQPTAAGGLIYNKQVGLQIMTMSLGTRKFAIQSYSVDPATFAGTMSIGLNVDSTPSARLQLAGGSTSAGSASLKLTAGSLLTTPESGAVENNGTHLYYTNSTGDRLQLDNDTAFVRSVTASNGVINSGTSKYVNVIADTALLATQYDISGFIPYADTNTRIATKSNVALKLNISDTTGKWVYIVNGGYGINIAGTTQSPLIVVDTTELATPYDIAAKVDTGSNSYIKNQTSVAQDADYRIDGVARAGRFWATDTIGTNNAEPAYNIERTLSSELTGFAVGYNDRTTLQRVVPANPNGYVSYLTNTNVGASVSGRYSAYQGFTNNVGINVTDTLNDQRSFYSFGAINNSSGRVRDWYGFYYLQPSGSGQIYDKHAAIFIGLQTKGTNRWAIQSYSSAPSGLVGNVGIGIATDTVPRRRLELGAGTTAVAPLGLNSGTALTTPIDGSIEYHSSHLYMTIGSTRYQLDQQTAGFIPYTDTLNRKITTKYALDSTVASITAGGGIANLNGLTGASQTFATGTTGTDFGISSSGTTHTFNLPTASASNRGLLSTADWSAFNGKQAGDADLAAIAGLSPTNDDIIQRKAGAWTNRTMAQLKTDLALVKGDVGLGNVDNTSDATKNSAVAALTNKDLTSGTNTFPTFNQNTTGSAATLTTTRTIWGQNFNGSANVTGDITLGTANITMTGSIGATGARVTKLWATDAEFTNPPTVGGVALPTASSTTTFTNKTLTSPIISSISNTGTLTLPTVTSTIVSYRESNDASSATPTPIGDARQNKYYLTALATAPTFAAPSGTPANGNELLIRIKDNGTARALAWNAIYRGGTSIALPTTTTISKTMYVQFVYNSADSKWDLVGLTDGL